MKKNNFDLERAEALVAELLACYDLNNLKETPEKVAQMYAEIFAGTLQDPDKIIVPFSLKENLQDNSQFILIKDIEFQSMCEHHLLPFFGKVNIAYLPNKKNSLIAGIGQICKVVEIYSRRPQLQERLTSQIIDCLNRSLKPEFLGVSIEARHMCSCMRGSKKDILFKTISLSGLEISQESSLKSELINLLK